MHVGAMLLQVNNGQITIDEAERLLKDLPYEELGYAKLDHHRKLRSGFGETVFCQGKPDAYLAEIFRKLWERDGEPGQHQSSMSWFTGSFQRWFMIRFPEF